MPVIGSMANNGHYLYSFGAINLYLECPNSRFIVNDYHGIISLQSILSDKMLWEILHGNRL